MDWNSTTVVEWDQAEFKLGCTRWQENHVHANQGHLLKSLTNNDTTGYNIPVEVEVFAHMEDKTLTAAKWNMIQKTTIDDLSIQ